MTPQTDAQKLRAFRKLGGKVEDGEWIAWKLVILQKDGPFLPPSYRTGLGYRVGRRVTDGRKASKDPGELCAAGLHVHTTPPPKKTWENWEGLGGKAILECRIRPQDVASVPYGAHPFSKSNTDHYTSGPKFRVQSLLVVAAYVYSPRVEGGFKLLQIAEGYEVIP